MNGSTEKKNIAIELWKEKVKKTAEKANSGVRNILLRIVEHCENIEELLLNIKDLTCIEKLKANDLAVIDLVSDLMKYYENDLINSIKFAKINFKILRQNAEAVRSSSYLENYIKRLCSVIIKAFENKISGELKKAVKIQLMIILELQKIFSAEHFVGHCYIVELFVNIINENIDELTEIFLEIVVRQLDDPKFYNELFYAKKKESFLRYCSFVLEYINANFNKFYRNVTDTGFFSMLLNCLSDNLEIMEKDIDCFEQLKHGLVTFMINTNQNESSFEEKQLIEGVIGENYNLSVISFFIVCEFLTSIQSADTAKSYFMLFQDLLLSLWTPCVAFTENRQMFLAQFLKILFKSHNLKAFVKPSLMNFFSLPQKQSFDLKTSLLKVKAYPVAANYYQLLTSMHQDISGTSPKDLIDLMEAVGRCDWTIFSSIAIKVSDLIALTKDQGQKMTYLLKFNPLEKLKSTKVPLIVAQKLLAMLMTFSSKQTEKCEGLRNYIKSALQILLEIDISVRRLYIKLCKEPTIIERENATFAQNVDEIFKTSKKFNLIHACKQDIELSSNEPNQLANLEKMKVYTKWLSSQYLTNDEKEIVEEIITNLQKVRN